MIPHLIDAAREMDELFWLQAYGDRAPLMERIQDEALRRFAAINYGPWDRLEDNAPFVAGVGPKPAGANLYPADLTKEELERAAAAAPDRGEALLGLYTLVRRDASGALRAGPYHEAYAAGLRKAADHLRRAAALAEEPGLKRYLELRAEALVTDDYRPSDLAWMDMKDNTVDLVIGPIETYEDQLMGRKAAYEAYVLVKDKEWSARLARYAALLPDLQNGLPVPEAYRKESPGTASDLNAYQVLYYAGDCNAGSKTIAINLPNDEQVQLEKGTRRLQLKNAMQAKFDRILSPIASRLVAGGQKRHVTFDAFFANVMFHEVAHGLGIKNTITGRGTVREALQEQTSALEEAKADVLGLYMVRALARRGELGDADLMDNYVTFMAGIFRSVRFGASSAHGRGNAMQFDFFTREGAFVRDQRTGAWSVDRGRMEKALDALSETILRLQGDGDIAAVREFMARRAVIPPLLQQDLDGLASAGIPVDVVFEQGPKVLGL
jgi:hypothetical protein